MVSSIGRDRISQLPEGSGHPAADRYQLDDRIGTGRFGTVYRASEPALGRSVAVKILDDHGCGVPEIRESFVQEAQRQRGLRSGHVVAVHDIDEIGGRPAVIQEYVAGGSLQAELDRNGPLGLDDVRRLVLGLSAVLRMLTRADIVHRHLTPGAFLLRRPGVSTRSRHGRARLHGCEFVLADLGLTRGLSADRLALPAGIGGYRAPEQERIGVSPTERTDVYAATQVLLAAASGCPMLPAVLPHGLSAFARSTLARFLHADPRRRPAGIEEWTTQMLALAPELTRGRDRRIRSAPATA